MELLGSCKEILSWLLVIVLFMLMSTIWVWDDCNSWCRYLVLTFLVTFFLKFCCLLWILGTYGDWCLTIREYFWVLPVVTTGNSWQNLFLGIGNWQVGMRRARRVGSIDGSWERGKLRLLWRCDFLWPMGFQEESVSSINWWEKKIGWRRKTVWKDLLSSQGVEAEKKERSQQVVWYKTRGKI